jgi:hypothetical protein
MYTEQERINLEAMSYLDSTDWYIIREIETGVPCPQAIKDARAAARARIVK